MLNSLGKSTLFDKRQKLWKESKNKFDGIIENCLLFPHKTIYKLKDKMERQQTKQSQLGIMFCKLDDI